MILPIVIAAAAIFGATQVFRIPGVDLPEGTVPDPETVIAPTIKAAAPWVVGGLIAYKLLENRL